MENGKLFTILGWVATATANCALWVTYGLLKKPKRDYPVAIANAPGIIFGLLAFATAL